MPDPTSGQCLAGCEGWIVSLTADVKDAVKRAGSLSQGCDAIGGVLGVENDRDETD
jgi:hypothetical protein